VDAPGVADVKRDSVRVVPDLDGLAIRRAALDAKLVAGHQAMFRAFGLKKDIDPVRRFVPEALHGQSYESLAALSHTRTLPKTFEGLRNTRRARVRLVKLM
jgi:hypothetical protein